MNARAASLLTKGTLRRLPDRVEVLKRVGLRDLTLRFLVRFLELTRDLDAVVFICQ